MSASYVCRNETDRTDAAALREAVRSGDIPSVLVKRMEQQALVAVQPGARAVDPDAHGAVSIPCADSCESTASCGQPDEPALLDRADTSPSAHLRQILASVHADVRDAVGDYPCWPGGHTSPHTGQIYDCRRSTGHVPPESPACQTDGVVQVTGRASDRGRPGSGQWLEN